ncbi:tRNA pseudouridine(55) synthase TruB [Anaeromyxobacter oryzae]|uniref:tRNA pseudouridine synthase B n=1 Tax=Anaeromyxobacter oryzae TaxID=2918170 RepID=A0ABM7WRB6_9BACT|nr:tRNA pseudouridine(55) synthase TruB [Anaeromyxobacter oryzae]BDG02026.1 tRNA pseudouridine synthase B [Anaeromyxobacter oryzae]
MSGTSGVLVVDKPAGPTSFEVVKRVKRALGVATAGHAGTLDPAATGVLAVCAGDAVKLQQFLVDGDKAYEATVALGAATATEDQEGEVIARGDPSGVTLNALRAAAATLVGWIDQVPPMYSAVRVGGRRLHVAARAGEAVERAPRRVRVDALEVVDLAPPIDGIALARLRVRCGKGTYVRTLAADLGRAVGVPAHLAALRRTMASGFGLEQAIPLEAAEALARAEGADALRARLVPLAAALGFLPATALTARDAWDLVHGRPVARPPGPPGTTRALGPDGRLVAVCGPGEGRLRPLRVFLGPSDLRPPSAGQDR